MTKLFEPVKIGRCNLEHRIVMAPMTRQRSSLDMTPTNLMVEYYKQRATIPGTLLISEATSVSERAAGRPLTPGLYTKEHVAAWRAITRAVHDAQSYIFVQLWVTGRAVQQDAVDRGAWTVAPSVISLSETSPKPRALTEKEIWQLIEDHRIAAINAIEAGFDGVEIHGANGYLVDQFTQDVTNQRSDSWGGSIENRARFGIEVAKAVVGAIGADRTGYRISPWCKHHNMGMVDPVPQFSYLVDQLKGLKIAYLHIIEARVKGNDDFDGTQSDESVRFLTDIWGNTSPVILAGGYNRDKAIQAANNACGSDGVNILVAFGRQFVSNPDLARRVRENLPFSQYNRDLFYTNTAEGYIDYAFSLESRCKSA